CVREGGWAVTTNDYW
nr:immunoglobulin heavy chain junction region [Macaca mulatta]MOV87653.1 immunoglobulin heavy chain junction region [Macaca mulatta]MOV87691.1 immunoglobulin heavy chain junction region [Macaca mulatta]MOV87839.1 immunoglobulin heavy chain junction region [Macaca mulatta]MOV88032.1 immunoglobulin heavy chain junction region [Macaca mulatta]